MTSVATQFRLTVKDDAVVITLGADNESIYTYDRAGRLFAAWVNQRLYRRGLDNRLIEKHTVRASGLRTPVRRVLDEKEKDDFLDRAAQGACDVEDALGRGRVEILWSAKSTPSFGEALRLVAEAAAFDAQAARLDAERFATVYRPVGILPPDQYLALVLQVTEGCHWNRCTFCTFYRQIAFRVKPISELEHHLDAVTRYLGEGVSLRRSIFLGEANALALPTDDLAARLDLITRWFATNGTRSKHIYSFLDIFTGQHKTAQEFAELRQRGLQRVYVGIETGDDALLAFLNKPQRAADAAALVSTLKRSGLEVGVIAMAGVGGAEFAESHTAKTVDLLNRLPLDAHDLIYLSAFVEHPHADYVAAARARGIRALSPPVIHAQLRAIRNGLRFAPRTGPRVARYDVEEFLY